MWPLVDLNWRPDGYAQPSKHPGLCLLLRGSHTTNNTCLNKLMACGCVADSIALWRDRPLLAANSCSSRAGPSTQPCVVDMWEDTKGCTRLPTTQSSANKNCSCQQKQQLWDSTGACNPHWLAHTSGGDLCA